METNILNLGGRPKKLTPALSAYPLPLPKSYTTIVPPQVLACLL
jgi:hypothetical protein